MERAKNLRVQAAESQIAQSSSRFAKQPNLMGGGGCFGVQANTIGCLRNQPNRTQRWIPTERFLQIATLISWGSKQPKTGLPLTMTQAWDWSLCCPVVNQREPGPFLVARLKNDRRYWYLPGSWLQQFALQVPYMSDPQNIPKGSSPPIGNQKMF